MEMAGFNRQRFSAPNYGPVSYPRNDYQSHSFMRDGPHMMRNMNENGPSPFQRFSGSGGGPLHGRHQYGNDDRMQGHIPFRPRSAVNQNHNSRMTPSGMLYRQQPYGGPDYFPNNNMGRMRHPVGPNERFFVPWNQRPEPYFSPRGPPRNTSARQSTFQQKSNARTNEAPRKRKRNKKKKYNPRPREDAKKLKPWMTDEIYDEVKKKNELYVRAKNEDKPELWQEFKLVRNKVSSMIKDAKLKGGFITRKLKEDDDVDKPFSCDNCDRAFTTEVDVEEHKKEHIKCDSAGCSFEAHPKVIELHKKMLHDTGYADVILKLNNTEEITKWRDARKSRYPTAENINKRKLELAEKIARGEVLETEQFGKFKKQRFSRSINGRFRRHRGRGGYYRGSQRRTVRTENKHNVVGERSTQLLQKTHMSIDSGSDDDSHIKLFPFPGLAAVEKNSCTESGSNAEVMNNTQPSEENSTHEQKIVLSNESDELHTEGCNSRTESSKKLSELESMHNADPCESDNEMPSTEPILKLQSDEPSLDTAETTINNIRPCKRNYDGIPKYDSKGQYETNYNSSSRKQKEDAHNSSNKWPAGLKKRNLLDKLLANEIRHERNVILQCVRYIVKNNFFRKKQTASVQ